MPETVVAENIVSTIVDDDFLVDVDQAFETIQLHAKKKVVKRVKRESEFVHMQSTFLAIAQVHLGPVLRYLKAIELGLVSQDLRELIQLVVSPLISKTKKVGLIEQAHALKRFQKELSL